MSASISPVSLTWTSPCSSTIVAAGFPVLNISTSTSLPCLPLIFASSIRRTSAPNSAAATGESTAESPFASSSRSNSDRIQFVVVSERAFGHELRCIGVTQSILLGKSLAPVLRQLRQLTPHRFDKLLRHDQRRQIGLRKIAIIVRLLFRTHHACLERTIVPEARLLTDTSTRLEHVDVSCHFKLDRALHEPNRV